MPARRVRALTLTVGDRMVVASSSVEVVVSITDDYPRQRRRVRTESGREIAVAFNEMVLVEERD